MRTLLLCLLLPACFGSIDAEESEPTAPLAAADEPAPPKASECVVETYSASLCHPEKAHQVCNGVLPYPGWELIEVIYRDEKADPLPNQESIYWQEWPPGARYVYCSK